LIVYLVVCIACAAVLAVVYKSIPYFRFAYPSAKVQAIGNPFVEEREINKLLELKSLESFKNAVNSFKDYKLKGERACEIHSSLEDHLIESIEMLKRDCTKKLRKFFDAYINLRDGEKLKHVIKKKIAGEKIEEVKVFSQEARRLINLIRFSSLEEIPDLIKDTYKELADLLRKGERDTFAIDASIDRENLKRLMEVKVPKEVREIYKEFILRIIDVMNIRNILRGRWLGYDENSCRKLLVGEGFEVPKWRIEEMLKAKSVNDAIKALEGTRYFNYMKEHIGDIRSIQPLETALDKALLSIGSEISTRNYPLLGPIIDFMIAKEMEIRNLKIICKGIEDKLKPERMKNLLVVR